MSETKIPQQLTMLNNRSTSQDEMPVKKKAHEKANGYEPPNLGKAIRLTVPDFNDPNRPPVCLEVDFPIAPINALSSLEGNAGKPIVKRILMFDDEVVIRML